MKVALFGAKTYEKPFFAQADAASRHAFTFFDTRLFAQTALLAAGHQAVCVFVNDCLDGNVLETLHRLGIGFVALRCAGFNNVDLAAAERLGMPVVRVPAYSPHAVAEHTVALMLDLNRKIHRAYYRVHEGNFALDGLMGFDMAGLTAGIVGTGRIGKCVARILNGFGVSLLAYDPQPNPELMDLGVRYAPFEEVLENSDIITLHCPLTPESHHLIDREAVARMKRGVMLVNTSRGEVVDTRAVIGALKSGQIGYLGLDVYEEEADLFFQDLSDKVIQDDVFSRLLTFPNVVVTAHQAFFTRNALEAIARTTLSNLDDLERTGSCLNQVRAESHRK